METYKDLPMLAFTTEAGWQEWLSQHYQDPKGIWLRFYKKGSGQPTIVYARALDVALCYGWIDSQTQKYDELSYLQKFTPRRRRSPWSKINREKAERLISAGRMQPAGQREIDAAKADGRWNAAYDAFSRAEIPPDFQALLAGDPEAKAFFEQMTQTNRYAVLYRIQTAKKPETRQRRMAQLLDMLRQKRTLH